MSVHSLPRKRTVGVDISIGTFSEHVAVIAELGREHCSSYVCCVNAHMTVEADRDPDLRRVVNQADLATADGMPLLGTLNRAYRMRQERVAGNDLLPAVLAEAEKQRLSVLLYGGKEDVLGKIQAKAAREFPALRIVGAISPPFRPLTVEEMTTDADRITASGAHIVMVSLGCPKQERWMAAMKGRIPAVMLGLGGAFLLYAEVDPRAPEWMRRNSLEWLYRFALEPRRLWKRYLVTNPLFLALAWKQRLFGVKPA